MIGEAVVVVAVLELGQFQAGTFHLMPDYEEQEQLGIVPSVMKSPSGGRVTVQAVAPSERASFDCQHRLLCCSVLLCSSIEHRHQ